MGAGASPQPQLADGEEQLVPLDRAGASNSPASTQPFTYFHYLPGPCVHVHVSTSALETQKG